MSCEIDIAYRPVAQTQEFAWVTENGVSQMLRSV